MPGTRPRSWWERIPRWPISPRSRRPSACCSTRSAPSTWRRRDQRRGLHRPGPAKHPPVTRIIAGAAKGRRLAVPAGRATRPTSDRTREGMFAAVVAALGSLTGTAVLDLYAGSGAVGLEALSRGASDVILIESDPGAA